LSWALLAAALGAACAKNDVSVQYNRPAGQTGPGAGGSGPSGGSAGFLDSGGVEDSSVDVTIGPPPDGPQEFTRARLLEAFGQCALAHYVAARDRAEELVAALQAADTDPHGGSVRAAWVNLIDTWEQAEVMQFGPAATVKLPGGQDLRDNIYSWPVVTACEIDKLIVSKEYELPTFSSTLDLRVRTLNALEYLIFHSTPDNLCPTTSAINSSGAWLGLSATELGQRRLAYARVVAAAVHARTESLADAWDPAGGNFLGALSSAGNGSAVYASDQAAFNAVNNAIFYVEVEVKDFKLGKPLGKTPDCTAPPCLDWLESRFAHRSKQHVTNNLIGFRKLFVGCGNDFGGLGFDDLLTATNAEGLAQQMIADLDAAIAAGDAIEEGDLGGALRDDFASVDAWWVALKGLTDALKSEFIGVLGLERPPRAPEGDND
jgi:predicted lipoprotein